MPTTYERHGRRTEVRLHSALISLVAEKGFDAVTIADIADRAMVHRATFYRHYCDKYALVTAIYEKAIQALEQELGPLEQRLGVVALVMKQEDAFREPAMSPELDHALVSYTALFEHFADHARLYKALLGKHGSSWFGAQFRDLFAKHMQSRLQESRNLLSAEQADLDLRFDKTLTMGLANWFVGVIASWLEEGMKTPPRQIAIFSLRFLAYGMYPYIQSLNAAMAHKLVPEERLAIATPE